MSKPKRLSLVERAAQVYDLSSGLRRPEAPSPVPPPREQQARIERAIRARPQAPVSAPAPVAARARVAEREVAHVDRTALARAGIIMPDAQNGATAEEFRLIKRRLLASIDARTGAAAHKARIVLIASGQSGEGKTFVALNLAMSIAGEQDREVLLVDGDFAKPELLDRLGIDADEGFVDALVDPDADPEELVIPTDIKNLSVIASGRRERNVPELLASARTGEVLRRLLDADSSRIILFDSPPVLAASPAAVLASHAGETLVVVRADRTTEADLKETLDLLAPCDRINLMLNGAAFSVGSRFGRYEEYGS